MDVRVRTAPVPRPRPTPKTVVVSALLELAAADLEQVVQRELSENPALEVTETSVCERCGATLSGTLCPHCRDGARQPAERFFDRDEAFGAPADWADEEWDPFSTVAAPWSSLDHLLWQLSPLLSDVELDIASLLLENLDQHGLLDCDLESVASALRVPVSQVEDVLCLIQRQDPVGIGARTVEESLLIQLEALEGDGELVALCARLVQDHWEALCKGKLDKIAQSVGTDAEELARARDFIKANLCPHPIHACAQASTSADRPVDALYLRPDVMITVFGSEGEERFEIRFPEESRFRLGLDRTYRAFSEEGGGRAAKEQTSELEHVRQCVDRGKLFLSSWHERWQTLHRVVEGLVEHQREFLLDYAAGPRPLTRSQLADEVGVHESTVSRAVTSKYAMIPGGRIVALADFFDGSLRAKSLIKEWVSAESHPLTDGELSELLAEAGVPVARRTVAKYRQALRILPSELR